MSPPSPHIALFPSPGMGHLIPFVELAKLLLARRHIAAATLILPTTTTTTTHHLLRSLPENIHHHFLPPITPTTDTLTPESQIFHIISLSLASARGALASLATSPSSLAALVVDPFSLDLVDAAKDLNVPAYMYFGSAAMNLVFTFHLPRFDEMVGEGEEFEDVPNPFLLPGCAPLHGRDFGDPFKNRKSETYKRFLHQSVQALSVDGILVNTFTELETGAINALKEKDPNMPPVFPIGPIIVSGQDRGLNPEGQPVVEWLDRQPDGSVLYVSFGSGGTLSFEQIRELAFGLEESGQRFLWVVRCPNDANSCPSYCGPIGGEEVDPLGFLPKGFTDRTHSRGLVVPNWAPQVTVLSHKSIGGFLTHCGWNSTLESLMHGVPLVAWPLHAEQRTNAVLLVDGLEVALRPESGLGGVVGGEKIARVVKQLMEGSDNALIRDRAKKLQDGARKAVGEGGSSTLALDQLGLRLKGSMD